MTIDIHKCCTDNPEIQGGIKCFIGLRALFMFANYRFKVIQHIHRQILNKNKSEADMYVIEESDSLVS